MTLPATRTAFWLALTGVAALLLAGCAAPAVDSGGDTGSDAASGAPAAGSGEACPTIAGYEYFSDSMITASPEPGAPFGDGSLIEFDGPDDLYPLYTLYYVSEDGEVLPQSAGGFSEEQPPGIYSTDLLVFGEEANNRPGILELETVYHDGMTLDTPDPAYVDGVSTVVVGRYCLTLKVNP